MTDKQPIPRDFLKTTFLYIEFEDKIIYVRLDSKWSERFDSVTEAREHWLAECQP